MNTHLKRVLVAASLAVATTGAGLAVAASATAKEAACVLHVTLPSKVELAPNATVSAPLTIVDCPYEFGMDVDAGADGDLITTAMSYSNDDLTDGFTILGGWDGPGVYSVGPIQGTDIATDANGNPVPIDFSANQTVAKYGSRAYIASSRHGQAVYVHGLFKRYSGDRGGTSFGADGGRDVYLQRYLSGRGWQTILHRTADRTGHLTVGFIQPRVQQYRWVVTEQPLGTMFAAWGANSASTFR